MTPLCTGLGSVASSVVLRGSGAEVAGHPETLDPLLPGGTLHAGRQHDAGSQGCVPTLHGHSEPVWFYSLDEKRRHGCLNPVLSAAGCHTALGTAWLTPHPTVHCLGKNFGGLWD